MPTRRSPVAQAIQVSTHQRSWARRRLARPARPPSVDKPNLTRARSLTIQRLLVRASPAGPWTRSTSKRSLGPVRKPGSGEGLTKAMAERRLRDRISNTVAPEPPVIERMSIEQAGQSLIQQLILKGRKVSTTGDYESYLVAHLAPFFGDAPIAQITSDEVESFLDECLAQGIAVKSALNYLGFLHGIFEFAIRKRWAHHNPCKEVERPRAAEGDGEIRFLDHEELDALLRATGAARSRHSPKTLERAARVRQLRDLEAVAGSKSRLRSISRRQPPSTFTGVIRKRCSRTIWRASTECSTSLRP